MTNTYKDSDPIEVKHLEELRCLRCVAERILRVMDEGLFVDYQMEKFGKNYKQKKLNDKKFIKKMSDFFNASKLALDELDKKMKKWKERVEKL